MSAHRADVGPVRGARHTFTDRATTPFQGPSIGQRSPSQLTRALSETQSATGSGQRRGAGHPGGGWRHALAGRGGGRISVRLAVDFTVPGEFDDALAQYERMRRLVADSHGDARGEIHGDGRDQQEEDTSGERHNLRTSPSRPSHSAGGTPRRRAQRRAGSACVADDPRPAR